jgi:ATP-dependent DNA helicase RecG
LPEPDFELSQGFFVTTLWRDWLTADVLDRFDLNDRQKQAVVYLKSHASITNAEYQRLTGAIRKTAARDLSDLVEKGVLERKGEKRSSRYILRAKAMRHN